MNKQEIFDKVWNGLKSQGFKQSKFDYKPSCSYRGPDGLKCAVGWLMADEEYDFDMEGFSANQLYSQAAYRIKPFAASTIEQRYFVGELQTAHDSLPETMEEELRKVAERHSLTVPE